MPNDVEDRIENALAPIRGKLLFIAASIDVGVFDSVKAPDPMVAADLLRDVDRQIIADIIEPMYENGAEPETGEGATPSGSLYLDEEGVRELVMDLYRVGWAATQDKDSDQEELERRLDAINRLANLTADRLCEAAGIPLHDETTDEFFGATKAFGEKAAEVGRAAVLEVEP